MMKILILGAGGQIACHVVEMLAEREGISMTLFLRNATKLDRAVPGNAGTVEGDVHDAAKLKAAYPSRHIGVLHRLEDLAEEFDLGAGIRLGCAADEAVELLVVVILDALAHGSEQTVFLADLVLSATGFIYRCYFRKIL